MADGLPGNGGFIRGLKKVQLGQRKRYLGLKKRCLGYGRFILGLKKVQVGERKRCLGLKKRCLGNNGALFHLEERDEDLSVQRFLSFTKPGK
jgi:hypothetical protein